MTVLSLNLPAAAENRLIDALQKSATRGDAGSGEGYSATSNNCANAVMLALIAAGVVKNTENLPAILTPAWIEAQLMSGKWGIDILDRRVYDWQALAPMRLPNRNPLGTPGEWLTVVDGIPR